MPTSSPVRTARTTKMIRYSFRFTWAIVLSLRDEVDEREHQDPDQVDEVPEQTDDLDAVVVVVVVAAHGLAEDDREVDDAGEDVHPVEARRHEEGARVGGVTEDETRVVEVRVLVRLAAEEEDA